MHWIPVITVAAIAQVAVSPKMGRPIPVPVFSDEQLNLDVVTTLVEEARPIIDVEIRNAATRAVEAPVTGRVWLTPIEWRDGQEVNGLRLSAVFDPTQPRNGKGRGPERSSTLRLPVGGSRTLRLDLHKLLWTSSAPYNVWTPRALFLVAEQDQRDFWVNVQVKRASEFADGGVSRDLRLRIEPE